MIRATIEKEIVLDVPNKVGAASQLNEIISKDAKSNIKALWAGERDSSNGVIAFITDNNEKVKKSLEQAGYKQPTEKEVVVLQVQDQTGSLAEVTRKLAEQKINIHCIFTTQYEGKPAIVISTDESQKVAKLFK